MWTRSISQNMCFTKIVWIFWLKTSYFALIELTPLLIAAFYWIGVCQMHMVLAIITQANFIVKRLSARVKSWALDFPCWTITYNYQKSYQNHKSVQPTIVKRPTKNVSVCPLTPRIIKRTQQLYNLHLGSSRHNRCLLAISDGGFFMMHKT